MSKNMVVEALKTILNAIPDVKYASSEMDPSLIFQDHNASVVVETWMGGRLYIYLIDTEPKVRDLRAILRENTRCGIGTLFIVASTLLPPPGDITKVADWQVALFSLNDQWIYSYHWDEAGDARIEQVHFSQVGYGEQFHVWLLPDFHIETCVVRTREYEEGIKGVWVVGDLASTQYKRRINYERQHQRFHYSTRQTRSVPLKPPSDQLMAYYQMLGLERNASEKEVKRAFRQMALRVHPDVSALPRMESERRIKELNEAYNYIKDYYGWS